MKEEEVEEVVEEVDVGVKRKAEEETEQGKTKKKWTGNGFAWTEEEDDALLKGVGKYGLDWKRIKEKNGKVLADRTPRALKERLNRQYPAKYEEGRAAIPRKHSVGPFWTAEEDDALKRGTKEHGTDWRKIHKSEKALGRRTLVALQNRYSRNLRK